jgi:hypothetical protein
VQKHPNPTNKNARIAQLPETGVSPPIGITLLVVAWWPLSLAGEQRSPKDIPDVSLPRPFGSVVTRTGALRKREIPDGRSPSHGVDADFAGVVSHQEALKVFLLTDGVASRPQQCVLDEQSPGLRWRSRASLRD